MGKTSSKITFKIVIIGDSGVGKSAILQRFQGNSFAPIDLSARRTNVIQKSVCISGEIIELQIWDTLGAERYRAIANEYCKQADAVVLVFDLTKKPTFDSLHRRIPGIRNNASEIVPILLIGNKSDLTENRQVEVSSIEKLFCEYPEIISCVESSAMQDTGALENSFHFLFEHLLKLAQENTTNLSPMPETVFKIILLGQRNVGKTTILRKLQTSTETIEEEDLSLYNIEFVSRTFTVNGHDIALETSETRGQTIVATTKKCIDSHGIFLVFDLTNSETFEWIAFWIKELRALSLQLPSITLLGNKSDLKEMRQVSSLRVQEFIEESPEITRYMETSAFEEIRIVEIFSYMAHHLVEKQKLGN